MPLTRARVVCRQWDVPAGGSGGEIFTRGWSDALGGRPQQATAEASPARRSSVASGAASAASPARRASAAAVEASPAPARAVPQQRHAAPSRLKQPQPRLVPGTAESGAGSGSNSARQTRDAPLRQAAAPSRQQLPSHVAEMDIKATVDPRTGKTYYYDRKTRQR
jgi:hypothetical protein